MTPYGFQPLGVDMEKTAEQVQMFAPAIAEVASAVTGGESPESLQAKIENARAMKRQFPFLAVFYDNRINNLKGRLAAAQRKQAESEKKISAWRTLGQAAIMVGIVFGIAVTARVVAGGRK